MSLVNVLLSWWWWWSWWFFSTCGRQLIPLDQQSWLSAVSLPDGLMSLTITNGLTARWDLLGLILQSVACGLALGCSGGCFGGAPGKPECAAGEEVGTVDGQAVPSALV